MYTIFRKYTKEINVHLMFQKYTEIYQADFKKISEIYQAGQCTLSV